MLTFTYPVRCGLQHGDCDSRVFCGHALHLHYRRGYSLHCGGRTMKRITVAILSSAALCVPAWPQIVTGGFPGTSPSIWHECTNSANTTDVTCSWTPEPGLTSVEIWGIGPGGGGASGAIEVGGGVSTSGGAGGGCGFSVHVVLTAAQVGTGAITVTSPAGGAAGTSVTGT